MTPPWLVNIIFCILFCQFEGQWWYGFLYWSYLDLGLDRVSVFRIQYVVCMWLVLGSLGWLFGEFAYRFVNRALLLGVNI